MSEEPEEQKEIECDVAIQFAISKNGEVFIYLHLGDDESSETEDQFAKFCFDLNTGQFINDIINVINEYTNQHPKSKNFLKNVITKWGFIANVVSNSRGEDELVVRPSNFMIPKVKQ